jgi:hypothetical protein
MDIVWQDSPGSFLDPGSIDAASAFAPAPGADGSALWLGAPSDVFAPSDALLWEPSSGGITAADASPADWFGASTKSFDIAWTDDSGGAPALLWQSNGLGALAPFSAAVSLGGTEWSSPYTPPDILWSSGEPNNAPFFGTPQPALTMAASPAPFTSVGPFGAAPQSLASIPPSQLLWDSTAFAPGQASTPSGGQPSGYSPAGASSAPTIAATGGDLPVAPLPYLPQSGSAPATGLPAYTPTHG